MVHGAGITLKFQRLVSRLHVSIVKLCYTYNLLQFYMYVYIYTCKLSLYYAYMMYVHVRMYIMFNVLNIAHFTYMYSQCTHLRTCMYITLCVFICIYMYIMFVVHVHIQYTYVHVHTYVH